MQARLLFCIISERAAPTPLPAQRSETWCLAGPIQIQYARTTDGKAPHIFLQSQNWGDTIFKFCAA